MSCFVAARGVIGVWIAVPALDLDVELLAGVHREEKLGIAPARSLGPVDGDDAVPGLDARRGAGPFGSICLTMGGWSS
jgi:hypothetical protein